MNFKEHPYEVGLNGVVGKNQQRKEQACCGIKENISKTWGEILPLTENNRLDWYEQGDEKLISPGG